MPQVLVVAKGKIKYRIASLAAEDLLARTWSREHE
jgi:hypothetical protein